MEHPCESYCEAGERYIHVAVGGGLVADLNKLEIGRQGENEPEPADKIVWMRAKGGQSEAAYENNC